MNVTSIYILITIYWIFYCSNFPAAGEVDVLLTHTPASGCQDKEISGHEAGCAHLQKAVAVLGPAVHVFGHVHSDYGVTVGMPGDDSRGLPALAINAASISDFYLVGDRVPVVFDFIAKE